MLKKMKVTVAQLTPKLGDKQFNVNKVKDVMQKAAESNSDLVVFPELFLSGYSVGNQIESLAESLDGPSLKEIRDLCKKLHLHVVISFPEVGVDGNYYISSALIDHHGEVLGTYRKTHLFDTEKKTFTPGSEFKVIPSSLGNIGLMICFDVEFPEIARSLKLMGADIIVIVNANMDPYKDHHYTYAKSRAMENEIPVVICNRLGQENDLRFCGDSKVFDSWGKELLSLSESEGVETVEVPLISVRDSKMNYTSNRRKNLYSILTE